VTGVLAMSLVGAPDPSGVQAQSTVRSTATGTSIEAALGRYINGDTTVVDQLVSHVPPQTLVQAAARMTGPATRRRALFLLEVADRAAHPGVVEAAILRGRAVLVGLRSETNGGVDAVRFEWLWHQTAVGILQRSPLVRLQVEYLSYLDSPEAGAFRSAPSRIPLARAVAAELACCWQARGGRPVRSVPSSLRRGRTFEGAVALYRLAAKQPDLQREALVRLGRVLLDQDRPVEVVGVLQRRPDMSMDTLGFIGALTLGDALERLDRLREAAAAYDTALRIEPSSQLAGIGLASVLLRTGQVERAVAVAVAARQTGPGADDGRRGEFEGYDSRFVEAWIEELRGLAWGG
jgi:tetratricopeptide (TPR) repeat protein